MRTHSDFKVIWDRWDDPGDYPSGAGGGPLPSYWYPDEVRGAFVMERERDDELFPEFEDLLDRAQDECLATVDEWEIDADGQMIILTVKAFDAESVDREDFWP